MYQDTDPTDDPSIVADADALVRLATSHQGSRAWNARSDKRTPLPKASGDKWYYTGAGGSDKRLTTQARYHIIQVTGPVDFSGVAIGTALQAGSLFVDWEIEFVTPQMDEESVQRSIASPVTYHLVNETARLTNAGGIAQTFAVGGPGSKYLNLTELGGTDLNVEVNFFSVNGGGGTLGTWDGFNGDFPSIPLPGSLTQLRIEVSTAQNNWDFSVVVTGEDPLTFAAT